MSDRYEWLLAWRMLRGKRSTQLSIVSWMSTAGIALGVAALIVVLAVNTGFQAAFQDRILATWPHMVVMRRGLDMEDWRHVVAALRTLPFVRAAAPATHDDMMLAAADGRAGAVVRGIPAEAWQELPEGLRVAGSLRPAPEAPRARWLPGSPPLLALDELVAGARHAVIVGAGPSATDLLAVPVFAPQPGQAAVTVVDATRCRLPVDAASAGDAAVPVDPPGSPTATGPDVDGDAAWLDRGPGSEIVRRVALGGCGVAATWEVLDGPATLVLRQRGRETHHPLTLEAGTNVVAAAQAGTWTVRGPADVPIVAAGVAVIHLGSDPLRLQVANEQVDVEPGAASPWLSAPGALPAIVLGVGLAERLRVQVGDEVRAVAPMRADGDGGRGVRGVDGRFRVAAVLRTGFHDHDQRLAMVDLHAAQRFLGRGDVARWVEVRIDDPILARSQQPAVLGALAPQGMADLLDDLAAWRARWGTITAELTPGLEVRNPPTSSVDLVSNWVAGVRAARGASRRQMEPYRVLDWEDMNRNIFDAARMQKVAMSLFPFIIVLVAALNVVGTQAVVVHERARDIAILRAMGARRREVGTMFLVQGLAVGVVGTAVGLLVGLACCLLLDQVGYPLDPQVYLISRLPVRIEWQPFVLAGGSAVALCFGAAWMAARRAAERAPVDGLRRLD